MTRHGRLITVVVLSVLASAAVVACGSAPKPSAPDAHGLRGVTELPPTLRGAAAPAIVLRDARGARFDTAQLRGRPYLVTFLYTNCPDVCPLIGAEIQQALHRLGRDVRRVAAVAVTVDPRHDTPDAVRAWLTRHREPPEFHYLTGNERELRPVWRSYFAAPQIPSAPRSSHTAAIWFVDRRGRRVAEMSAGGPVAPSDIAGNLRSLLDA